MKAMLWRVILGLFMLAAIPLILFVVQQPKLIYHPRPYPQGAVSKWLKDQPGKSISFTTSQGSQTAFLQGNLKSPRHLWIVCGGNGTLALEWSDWLRLHAPAEDAWLLFEFPGYGECQGDPTPETILESLQKIVPLASKEIGWNERPSPERVKFFGHSLGAATCLIAASEFNLQKGILIAPFTSTMEMARHIMGVPLAPFVWQRFDNITRIKELAKRGHGNVIIFHGTADEVIPFSMAQELESVAPTVVDLRTIPNGKHNNLQETNTAHIASAFHEIAAQ